MSRTRRSMSFAHPGSFLSKYRAPRNAAAAQSRRVMDVSPYVLCFVPYATIPGDVSQHPPGTLACAVVATEAVRCYYIAAPLSSCVGCAITPKGITSSTQQSKPHRVTTPFIIGKEDRTSWLLLSQSPQHRLVIHRDAMRPSAHHLPSQRRQPLRISHALPAQGVLARTEL